VRCRLVQSFVVAGALRGIARAALLTAVGGFAPLAGSGVVDLDQAAPGHNWRVVNGTVPPAVVDGRNVLRFSEAPGGAFAWTAAIQFMDGEIEFDTHGRDVYLKSFVGVVYHVMNDSTFDLVYLRPFNFRATDSVRRAHAVQFTSYPTHSWERLRVEHPGMFEATLVPAPDPDSWVHVRVSVRGDRLQVYVNRASMPALVVRSPAGLKAGGIGLWVGDMSAGDFANLTVGPPR
jgi:hypothetical protein